MAGNPQAWGGPFYGPYQTSFVESFAVSRTGDSLFSDSECAAAPTPAPGATPAPPTPIPGPFANCPALQVEAEALCPRWHFAQAEIDNCIMDARYTSTYLAWLPACRPANSLDVIVCQPLR